MRRRRVTYRPSRATGILGTVMGGVFVLIGIFFAIPNAGAFGVLWTLFAVAITAFNAYNAFGKKYVGPEIRIEEEGAEDAPAAAPAAAPAGAAERLRELEGLRAQGLITEEEYARKRQEILSEL